MLALRGGFQRRAQTALAGRRSRFNQLLLQAEEGAVRQAPAVG